MNWICFRPEKRFFYSKNKNKILLVFALKILVLTFITKEADILLKFWLFLDDQIYFEFLNNRLRYIQLKIK